jgi:hypothetical protein
MIAYYLFALSFIICCSTTLGVQWYMNKYPAPYRAVTPTERIGYRDTVHDMFHHGFDQLRRMASPPPHPKPPYFSSLPYFHVPLLTTHASFVSPN